MPVRSGRDSISPYFQWGSKMKYRYIANDPWGRKLAKLKAQQQGIAIKISQHRKK